MGEPLDKREWIDPATVPCPFPESEPETLEDASDAVLADTRRGVAMYEAFSRHVQPLIDAAEKKRPLLSDVKKVLDAKVAEALEVAAIKAGALAGKGFGAPSIEDAIRALKPKGGE